MIGADRRAKILALLRAGVPAAAIARQRPRLAAVGTIIKIRNAAGIAPRHDSRKGPDPKRAKRIRLLLEEGFGVKRISKIMGSRHRTIRKVRDLAGIARTPEGNRADLIAKGRRDRPPSLSTVLENIADAMTADTLRQAGRPPRSRR